MSKVDMNNILSYDNHAIIYNNYYDYGDLYNKVVRNVSSTNRNIDDEERKEKKKKEDISKTELYYNNKKRRSMWDLLMECTEEIFTEMNINEENFTMEEWKMLMVTLQSRYGYGSDLRETSIAMSRLPFSNYLDIDMCPKYGSNNYILKNIKYYDKIKKNEQTPYISSFKDLNTSDKIVVDGWKWLINYLSEEVQNKIFLNTVAELVYIKDKHQDKKIYHLDNDNCQINKQKSSSFLNTKKKKNNNNNNIESVENNSINSDHVINQDNNSFVPQNEVSSKNKKKYINENFLINNVIKDDYKLGENNEDDYKVMIKCKCYDTKFKNINKHFHGTSDLNNCNYKNVTIYAKYVIVALPLGCLIENDKKRKLKTCLKFEPELHPLKLRALQNYKMGNHNKIILRFYPYNFTWPFDSLQINCIDQKFQFLNLHAYGKIGCILVHCFPPWSCTYGYIKKEHYIINECLYTLNKMFEKSGKKLPILVDYIITKWQDDNFSFGSYAYPYINCNDNDLIYLRSPHPINNPRVVFCGEYLSKSYFQCVDGAYDTGIRAAEDIAHIGLHLKNNDTKNYKTDVYIFPQNKCPFTNIPLPPIKKKFLGFYITDGSDEALTDYESSSDENMNTNVDINIDINSNTNIDINNNTNSNTSSNNNNTNKYNYCNNNIPISVMKKEYEFLLYSLQSIQNIFRFLKKQNTHKNFKQDKNINHIKNETDALKCSSYKKEIKSNTYESFTNNSLINFEDKKSNDVKSNISTLLLNLYEYNNKSTDQIHYFDRIKSIDSYKSKYKNGSYLLELHSKDSEHDSNKNDANNICTIETFNNVDKNNKGDHINDVHNDVYNDVYNDKYTSNYNIETYSHITNNHFEYINNISNLYINKYMIKLNDAVFYNYNEIENTILNKQHNAEYNKSYFVLLQTFSNIFKKYSDFTYFIQKELFLKIQAMKHILFNDNNFQSLQDMNVVLSQAEHKNDHIVSHNNHMNDVDRKKAYEQNTDIINEDDKEISYFHEKMEEVNNMNKMKLSLNLIKSNMVGNNNDDDNNNNNGHIQKSNISTDELDINKINLNSKTKNNNITNKKDVMIQTNLNIYNNIDLQNKIKNIYINNRKICYLNDYLKYVLIHLSISKNILDEQIMSSNNNKWNSCGFLFFLCYILQYILKHLKYDLFNSTVNTKVVIQLLCDYIYYLIFCKHDILCYKCMNGGELNMCDSYNCNNSWHTYCLSSSEHNMNNKNDKFLLCPSCSNIDISKHVQRGCYNQNEIMENYWKRRIYIYKIKFFLSRTRKIRKRLDLLKAHLSRSVA
ncbi:hypothetical protein PFMALIP_03659 [Plasmodium falciparum MaliPS096_E11]|uniref:PHD-type domain-containing protein n=1 Tax=Plasmodium falciparum MaliPS096_E11 TaxID=1036727 RepID=A0A024WP23_PLAFA|nr:hypothetical protein PFMALIP_03659 [Plasmodium falciparum MaliPS096_E11]